MIVDFLAGAVPDAEAFALSEAVTLGRLRGYAEHFGGGLEPARTHAEVTARWADARDAARGTGAVGGGVPGDARRGRHRPRRRLHRVVRLAPRRPDRRQPTGRRRSSRATPTASSASRASTRGSPTRRGGSTRPSRPGLSGVVLSPFKQQLLPEDPRMARVFGRCEALGVPVLLHTGINWSLDAAYDVGHPRYIDAVATRVPRPDARRAARRPGPGSLDMMMVAWRHPHVYLDLSAHRPRHFTRQRLGLGAAAAATATACSSDKVLFALDLDAAGHLARRS